MPFASRSFLPADAPRHWTVFRLGHLGDVLLCTGVMDRLAQEHGWSFTVITRAPWADVFSHHPHVRSVLALEEADLRPGPYLERCRLLSRSCAGTGLLDWHDTLRSRLLSCFWQGPVLRYPKMTLQRRLYLYSKHRWGGAGLLATTVPQRYYLSVASPPPPPEDLLPRLYLEAGEKAEARARLEALFGPQVAPVALHPYAANALKTWPAPYWRELVEELDRQRKPWICIGRGTKLFPERKEDLSNNTSLRQSAALLSCCRALITGDSGPMHLAAAVGVRVIALFGPTTREWGFYPSGPDDVILETALPCRPCSLHGKTACPRNGQCLSDIPPRVVLKKLEDADGTG